jgi:hypothetical protein
MEQRKHLSWDNFLSSILVKGQQRVHRVSNSPLIEIFGDGIKNTVGIWIECSDATIVPEQARRLASMSIQTIKRDQKSFLEVASSSSLINREFYLFATAIADRVLESRQSPGEAIASELRCFTALFEEKRLLSIERQLGLIGELIVLERMLFTDGPDALRAWIGPQGEPHDFRVGHNEFEVKASAGTRRIHTIHNLTQLIASPGSRLFIMSILLGPAGKDGGFSLATKIESVLRSLSGAPDGQLQFQTALKSVGYSDRDHSHYDRSFALRRPLAVVPINSGFPAVTASSLLSLLGQEAHRIDRFAYDVNIEGLESEEGTSLFASAFPYAGVI